MTSRCGCEACGLTREVIKYLSPSAAPTTVAHTVYWATHCVRCGTATALSEMLAPALCAECAAQSGLVE